VAQAERKWRKLVKTKQVWFQQAGPGGLHFTQNGEEHWVLPGDYVIDWPGERSLCRGCDLIRELKAAEYDDEHGQFIDVPLPWLSRERYDVIEVANQVVMSSEGCHVHPDLWVERMNFEASQREDGEKLIVHRQQYIEELLADGYQWEDAAS
jgi:hypothetical protein